VTSEPATQVPARLALRRVLIDTYHENVAYMHRDCDVYRAEGFKALSKVEIRANGNSILATLNVVDDQTIVACGELGLSKAAYAQLGVEDGHTVTEDVLYHETETDARDHARQALRDAAPSSDTQAYVLRLVATGGTR